MKYCKKCKTEKELNEFGKDKTKKDGLSTVCLSCRRSYDSERQKTDKRIELRKSDKMREWHKNYMQQPHMRKWKRGYEHEWRKNPQVRVAHNMRTLLRMCWNRNSDTKMFNNVVGCSIFEFKDYICSMFNDKMTMENYGTYWSFDHIKPCISFDLTDENEVKRCFHYSNTQPLELVENQKKSTSIQ